jgi:hypothetical protein
MSQLPTPGGNANNWGTMLNDYLQQSLASNGTLITTSTNSYTGGTNTNLASSSTPGLIRLSGDLSNTAASPTVVGLQGNAVNSATPSNGNVLTWSASSSQWSPQAPSTSGGSGGSNFTGDLDGGSSSSVYGGTTAIDGGIS